MSRAGSRHSVWWEVGVAVGQAYAQPTDISSVGVLEALGKESVIGFAGWSVGQKRSWEHIYKRHHVYAPARSCIDM